MKWIVGFLLCLTAGSVPAADVYRCVDRGGQVTLQNMPCPSGTRTASVKNVTTDEERSSEDHKRARDDAKRRMAENRRLAKAAGTDRVYHSSPQRRTPHVSAECEKAKQERAHMESKSNIDLRRRLNDAVFAACRGF